MTENCFDSVACYFDAYIPWEKRLPFEMPFLIDLLGKNGVKSVLDIGCGSGRHAVELAHTGFRVVGIDTSDCLLDTARSIAENTGTNPLFITADASDIGTKPGELMGPGGQLEGDRFDCCMLLGNTIALLGEEKKVADILNGIHEVMEPDGIVISQTPNYFDRIKRRDSSTRFRIGTINDEPCMLIKTLSFIETGSENPDVKLHLLRIIQNDGTFELEDNSIQIFPLSHDSIGNMLTSAGFGQIHFYGSMDGREFDPDTSPDCIVVASIPVV